MGSDRMGMIIKGGIFKGRVAHIIEVSEGLLGRKKVYQARCEEGKVRPIIRYGKTPEKAQAKVKSVLKYRYRKKKKIK